MFKLRDQIPPCAAAEGATLTFTHDNQTNGNALHTTRRQSRRDRRPEQRRDGVTREAIDDASCFLRLDEIFVDIAEFGQRSADCALGDFVEHHATHRHFRLQLLQQVPRNALAFAVFVSRQNQLVDILHRRAKFSQHFP